MRIDFDNDPVEVLKLQAFLINFEGHTNVSLTGVFDQATFDAVSAFQMKYFSDILEPWGHTGPTGYVYILTLKKINEIYCQKILPLTQDQLNEIIAFRDLIESYKSTIKYDQGKPDTKDIDTATTTLPELPVVGQTDCPICPNQGQIQPSLAAVLFAIPDNLLDKAKCLYLWLLIIFVLYILVTILSNVLYKDVPENKRKRFLTKWVTFDLGTILAIVLAYIFDWWCLILPLLITLIISLFWTSFYPEHNSIRASIKSWYLVGSARIKSMLKKETTGTKNSEEVILIESKKK